jgi:hypothetical protein
MSLAVVEENGMPPYGHQRTTTCKDRKSTHHPNSENRENQPVKTMKKLATTALPRLASTRILRDLCTSMMLPALRGRAFPAIAFNFAEEGCSMNFDQ